MKRSLSGYSFCPREGLGGGEDDLGGRLVPFAIIVEETIGADGADNSVASGLGMVGVFDDVLECKAESSATTGE